MSEPNNSAWPFSEITESEGFDIDAIFGTGNSAAAQADSFAAPAPVSAAVLAPAPVAQEAPTAPVAAPARCSCCPGTQGSCTCEGCCGSFCGKPHCRGL